MSTNETLYSSGSSSRVYKPQNLSGVVFALAAYLWWGLGPIYWKLLHTIPPMIVLAYRIFLTFVFVAILITGMRRWSTVFQILMDKKKVRYLLATACLNGIAWGSFVVAMSLGRVLEVSLGFYIIPLINILLGVVFLQEKLRKTQILAVVMVLLSVLILIARQGIIPWIAFGIGISFGIYGLLRKQMPVDSVGGLFVETLFLSPFCLIYMIVVEVRNQGVFYSGSLREIGLLALSGIVTAMPQVWFTSAAKRLTLSFLGILQYTAPTCQFFLAVLLYKELCSSLHIFVFSCIWVAIVIFSAEAYYVTMKLRQGEPVSQTNVQPIRRLRMKF